ncbi:MAG: HD domain-containing protein [Lachnospiraceae bacterium]|nr:HD domain-containing protein [Lachnospiraceae bacterium]
MQFVKAEDLKMGMRLARPIYSKKGVLLFDRNSKLTTNAIESVKNFGLLGIYILEPAEPLPPMTEEDFEFERFQTMVIFSIQEAVSKILSNQKQNKIQVINSMILKNYGHNEGKINFYQNLRSTEDYVYRHSLNVAILCALITHKMNIKREDQTQIIDAAIMHDIGKIKLESDIVYRDDLSEEEAARLYTAQMQGSNIIEDTFLDGLAIKRICQQAAKQEHDGGALDARTVLGAKVLLVANKYDELTAMSLGGDRKSEVLAIKTLLAHPETYDKEVVNALINSINILTPGVSIELSTGEKALVLAENRGDMLRPMVLCFSDNSILDLSLRVNHDIEVMDIMKTLDNRYIMDVDSLRTAGYKI